MAYLTPEEAAKELGITAAKLQNWRYAGKGPPYRKLEGVVRYDPKELKEWADSRIFVPALTSFAENRHASQS